MLSIGKMTVGQEKYYLNLAQEDYYLEGGEPEGHWLGSGAGELGLRGVVEAEELSSLFRGSPQQAVAYLLAEADISDRDLDEIRRMIDSQKQKKRRGTES